MWKLIFLLTLITGCGYFYETQRTDIEYQDAEEVNPAADYAFSDFDRLCFSCHNSSAPNIPKDEAGFKASKKVIASIKSGKMPPNKSGFNKARALEFFQ